MISADGMVLDGIRVDTRVALEERRLFAMRRRVNNAECTGIHFNVHYTRMQRHRGCCCTLLDEARDDWNCNRETHSGRGECEIEMNNLSQNGSFALIFV
jgi:hypothetical protein